MTSLRYLGSTPGSPPPLVSALLRGAQRIVWLTCVSFEARSATATERTLREARPAQLVVIDYATRVRPGIKARAMRVGNWDRLRRAATSTALATASVEPYSYYEIQDIVRDATANADCIVIDITCITKIHALAVATQLSHSLRDVSVLLCYTIPEHYRLPTGTSTQGWRDIVVSPLTEGAQSDSGEYPARGLICAGHEVDRLILSLAELEPIGGTWLFTRSDDRPDLWATAELRNESLVTDLIRLHPKDWRQVTVALDDPMAITMLATEEVRMAEGRGQVVLYPFGPKPIIVTAALSMASLHPTGSWFVYPIPATYDADYTYGEGETLWYGLDATTAT